MHFQSIFRGIKRTLWPSCKCRCIKYAVYSNPKNKKMAYSGRSNSLEVRNRTEDYFVALLTRGLLHLEYYNVVVVLATTLIMMATVSIVIHRLKRHRHAKTFDFAIINDRIDELSVQENLDAPYLLEYELTLNYGKLLSDLHSAAEKCYIEKYAERCVELVNFCPHLINTKFGSTGLTPFHRVCFHGHVSLIQFMLSMGANPYLTSDAGENVICLAVYYYLNKSSDVDGKNMPCLDILQRAGCKLERNSIWYNMLLKMAVRAGKTALIEWLMTNKQIPRLNRLERCNTHPLVF